MSSQSRSPNRHVKHLDPRAPFVIDTHDLGRSPGSMRELERVEEAPQAMGIDVIAIREGASIKLSLRLEAVVQGVLITGRAMAEASGECVRCLEPVTLPLDVYFQDLFTYEPDPRSKKTAQDFDDDDPLPELIDGMADLGPALVDAATWEAPRIFGELARLGSIDRHEMFRVFNCGIGMILVVPPEAVRGAVDVLASHGHAARVVGEVVRGTGAVHVRG